MLVSLESTGYAFSSRSVAARLRIPVSEASLDLMRLHKMGFLKRERVVRICRNGFTTCRRGYQYLYGFSRQGKSYLEWLKNHGLGDPLLHSLPWMQERASPTLTQIRFALKAPLFRPSRFKPSRAKQLRNLVIEYSAKENMELLEDKTQMEEYNEYLWSMLALVVKRLAEVKSSRVQDINRAIQEKEGEHMIREMKLRVKIFVMAGEHWNRMFSIRDIFRAFGSVIKAARPVGDYYVIPAGPLEKATEIITRIKLI